MVRHRAVFSLCRDPVFSGVIIFCSGVVNATFFRKICLYIKGRINTMLEHVYQFRVMYPDTDQMGTVHHSVYAKYYETARWELFRNIGISYRSIEDAGFLIPVVSMHFRFLKTIRYDDLLTVQTSLKTLKGARIWFTYKLFNSGGELVNEAETELAFVERSSWLPCIPPQFVYDAIYQRQETEPVLY
jgi:acyl-CoA thioester hydrolase